MEIASLFFGVLLTHRWGWCAQQVNFQERKLERNELQLSMLAAVGR